MSENTVEKVNGTWNGQPYSIKKVWGKNTKWEGHEFSAEECAKLFNGETIEFEAVSKAGKSYTAKGKLAKQTFTDDNGNEHEFVGFQLQFDEKPQDTVERFSGIWNGREVNPKRVWSEHRFTDEEVQKLLDGQTISFQAISQKTGNYYSAKGKLAEQEFNGNKFVGFKPEFN